MIHVSPYRRVSVRSAIVGLAMIAASLTAADWPQFLGPDRNGISPEKGLARTWPEGGPKVLWTFDLGPGFGGPAIVGGKVYFLDRIVDKDQDAIRCLDLATGKEDWSLTYDAPGKVDFTGPRGTPTVDGKRLFVVGPFGHFTCVDLATHKIAWTKNLLTDFTTKLPMWGVSQSPVLYKDWVIVAPQSRTVGLVAYKQDTGEEVWKSPSIGPMSYVSPALLQLGGVAQAVMITHDSTISGIAADDGKKLWSFKGSWKNNIPIPSVTAIGDGRLFVTGGYDCGSMMIKVEKQGDAFAATEVFAVKEYGSILHNALLYQNHLYLNCTTKTKTDGLVCLDLDGKLKWKTDKAPNFEKGCILLADGLILALDGNTGALALAEASPDSYKELARAKVLDGKGKTVWAPMALSDGKLIVRDQKQMKCLAVK